MEYVCDYQDDQGAKCGQVCKSENGLSIHRSKAHEPPVYGVCKVQITPDRVCGVIIKRGQHPAHMKRYHTNVDCRDESCSETFDHKTLMLDHWNDKHKKVFKCKFRSNRCQGSYFSKEKLTQHEQVCNYRIEEKEKEPEERFVPCQVLLSPGRQCGVVIVDNYCSSYHKRNWHTQLNCRDNSCNESFEHKQLMKEHFDDTHRKYWYCKNWKFGCRSTYTTKEHIRAHERTCDPTKKKFSCHFAECDAKFVCLRTLRNHLHLKHFMSVREVNDYLKTNDEDEDSDDTEDEEEGPNFEPNQFGKLETPLDSETGAEYKLLKFGEPTWRFKPLDYGLFLIYYHYGLRIPNFTFQILFSSIWTSNGKKLPRQNFRIDRSLSKIYRRGNGDYEGVAMHRGHMVRFMDYATDHNTAANTCLFSNVLPMLPKFNKSIWTRMENATADFAKVHTVTFVVTAGLFSEPIRQEGSRDLPIPNRFAKIMLGLNEGSNRWDLTVYDVPHNESYTLENRLSEFHGDLCDIEAQLNTKFFPILTPDKLDMVQQRQPQAHHSKQHMHKDNIVDIG